MGFLFEESDYFYCYRSDPEFSNNFFWCNEVINSNVSLMMESSLSGSLIIDKTNLWIQKDLYWQTTSQRTVQTILKL